MHPDLGLSSKLFMFLIRDPARRYPSIGFRYKKPSTVRLFKGTTSKMKYTPLGNSVPQVYTPMWWPLLTWDAFWAQYTISLIWGHLTSGNIHQVRQLGSRIPKGTDRASYAGNEGKELERGWRSGQRYRKRTSFYTFPHRDPRRFKIESSFTTTKLIYGLLGILDMNSSFWRRLLERSMTVT